MSLSSVSMLQDYLLPSFQEFQILIAKFQRALQNYTNYLKLKGNNLVSTSNKKTQPKTHFKLNTYCQVVRKTHKLYAPT